jgi:hypothetical protein
MERPGYLFARGIFGLGAVGTSLFATTCSVNEPVSDLFGICLAGATDCGFVDEGGTTSEPQCTLENPDCGDTVIEE